MNSTRFRPVGLAAALAIAVTLAISATLAALSGCNQRNDAAQYPGISVNVSKDGRVRIQERVTVTVDPEVRFATNYASAQPFSFLIDGQTLQLGDTLRIGVKSYGKLSPGDEVRIAQDGVYVNGELRGPLPKHGG